MALGLLQDAIEHWPTIEWSAEAFAEDLRTRGIEPVACKHLQDVYLASAALHGIDAAVRVLDLLVHESAGAAVSAMNMTDYPASDLAQDVLDQLLFGRGGSESRGRLTQYAGRGPLKGWLRTCTVNACLMHKRKQTTGHNATLTVSQTPDPADDPELAKLKARAGGQFKAALAVAVARLEPRSRTILRFHYLDGLEQREIAALYGVHPATISRWLADARRHILASIRKELELRDYDMNEIWPLMASRLDLSLRGMLRTASD